VTETFPLTAISGAWPRLPIFCQNPHDTYDLPRTNATATREEEIAALVQQGEEVIQQQGGMPILRVASEEYEEKSPDAEALVRQTKKRHQNTSSSTSSKGGKKGQGKKKGKGKGKGQSASEPAPPQQPQADAANTVEEEEVSLAALWAAKKAKRKQEGEE
jgi:hypothetical protein